MLHYIIACGKDITQVTAKDLAAHFYATPNTITRLAHKLGFTGFSELKTSYLVLLERRNFVIEETSLDTMIVRTRELLNDHLLDETVDAIDQASQIAFFASGLSVLPCTDLSRKLEALGKQTEVFNERHVMMHMAKSLNSTDVLFAVSVSGQTKVSIDSTSIAKSRGVKIITLTGLSKNPLAELADIALYAVDKNITYDEMDLSSRLTFFYIMEIIFERYFSLLSSRSNKDAPS
ncbi:MurR/RpiR family transcriptional regulator [Thermophilibacter immobilis]|nr:MurR/RpiR family transcriptional regulator [Thermophilibacter immobilis]